MSFISKMFSKAITTKANEEIKKKPSLLKLITTPEDFKLEAWIENEEVVIKIKKKGEQNNENN